VLQIKFVSRRAAVWRLSGTEGTVLMQGYRGATVINLRCDRRVGRVLMVACECA
jgi:hypothetical protein